MQNFYKYSPPSQEAMNRMRLAQLLPIHSLCTKRLRQYSGVVKRKVNKKLMNGHDIALVGVLLKEMQVLLETRNYVVICIRFEAGR
jgi:hypothetical protein